MQLISLQPNGRKEAPTFESDRPAAIHAAAFCGHLINPL